MKRCLQCNRVEIDDALTFCRVDGSPLTIEKGAAGEVETSLLPHAATSSGSQRL